MCTSIAIGRNLWRKKSESIFFIFFFLSLALAFFNAGIYRCELYELWKIYLMSVQWTLHR